MSSKRAVLALPEAVLLCFSARPSALWSPSLVSIKSVKCHSLIVNSFSALLRLSAVCVCARHTMSLRRGCHTNSNAQDQLSAGWKCWAKSEIAELYEVAFPVCIYLFFNDKVNLAWIKQFIFSLLGNAQHIQNASADVVEHFSRHLYAKLYS